MNDPELNQLNKIDKKIGLALLGVILFWLINASFILFFEDLTKSGQFGDTFGAVNSLFSGLAIVGLIYAIILQRQDLNLQRQDLKLQYEELKATRAEFEIQNETLKKQRFENTFFNLVSLHTENVNLYEVISSNTNYRGKDSFRSIYKDMNSYWSKREHSNSSLRNIESIYDYIYQRNNHILGHYFRSLYQIIKFIDLMSDLKENDKILYIKILRSQLSNYELCLLFYNCGYLPEGKKFKDYIEKYALLDNLPQKMLLDIKHTDSYAPSAYGQ